MKNIQLADVTIHIKEDTDAATRSAIESALRGINGVVSVHMPQEEPHLIVVEYDPDATKSMALLKAVKGLTGHADLIGL